MTRPRHSALFATLLAVLAFLSGCSGSQAPVGRWEGHFESAEWLVAVRLQVDKGNIIHATALSVGVAGVSGMQRLELTQKIKSRLVEEWPAAAGGEIDYYRDGTLRRKGGFAPLFTFDPADRTMTFYFYAHGKLTERIKLYPVTSFAQAA